MVRKSAATAGPSRALRDLGLASESMRAINQKRSQWGRATPNAPAAAIARVRGGSSPG